MKEYKTECWTLNIKSATEDRIVFVEGFEEWREPHLERINDDSDSKQVESRFKDLSMVRTLKEKITDILLIDEDKDDEDDWNHHKELNWFDSLLLVLVILILLDVEANFDECSFLDADVKQVKYLINVYIEDMAAEFVWLQPVPQAAEEEKE